VIEGLDVELAGAYECELLERRRRRALKAQLREMAAQWEKRASNIMGLRSSTAALQASALRECARELRALLQRPEPPNGESDE
jgi:hypothetical protein